MEEATILRELLMKNVKDRAPAKVYSRDYNNYVQYSTTVHSICQRQN